MRNATSDFAARQCFQVDSYRGTECHRHKGATVLHDSPAGRRRSRYMIRSSVGPEPSLEERCIRLESWTSERLRRQRFGTGAIGQIRLEPAESRGAYGEPIG